MRLFRRTFAISLLGSLMLICISCDRRQPATSEVAENMEKPAVSETKNVQADQNKSKPADQDQPADMSKEPAKAEAPNEPANIVAKIGDYRITKDEVKAKWLTELRPDPEYYMTAGEPVDANTVVRKLLADKAMMIEAREQHLLSDAMIQESMKAFWERLIVNLLLQNYVQGKIEVSDAEIAAAVTRNPKLTRERAKMALERTKAGALVNQYYDQIHKKFHVQKVPENFPKTAQIHLRLLLQPKAPRKLNFIRISQIRDELTAEEKSMVLATYDGGKVTLEGWFNALTEMAPPSRPKDLHTVEGVERLLDGALRKPLFIAEAKSLGLDKDENLLKQVRDREDTTLLNVIKRNQVRDINEPSEAQVLAYFNKNKEVFATPQTVKIDPVWCQDRQTAEKVKAELDAGNDFEQVKKQYSLQKDMKPYNAYPNGEGIFFDELYKADPNQIVGPIKGFYESGVKWRVVRVLEKKPAEPKEFSDELKNEVKWRLMAEQRTAVLDKFADELLAKYEYQIYADRLKGIDPLEIP